MAQGGGAGREGVEVKCRVVPGCDAMEMDYQSPRISSEVYECGLPLTFDQYSRCTFECMYCFAAFVKQVNSGSTKGKANSQFDKPIRCVDPEGVKRLWVSPDRIKTVAGITPMALALIAKKAPLHWGGLSDPFDYTEEKYQVGLELLRFFRALDYPVVFSTKGILPVREPWRSVLAGGNFRFQQSIITTEQHKADVVDKSCPTLDQRFDAMRQLTREMGLVVTLRLRPIIPGIVSPKQCLELIERAHECGATGVSTEFFCMEARGFHNRWRYDAMSEVGGIPLFEYYKKHSPGQCGYLRLNTEVKRKYFEPMAALATRLKMRFAVSDFNFKHLNNCVGCCAIYSDKETAEGAVGSSRKPWINRGTVTYAIQLAKRNGIVRRAEIDEHLDWASYLVTGEFQGLMSQAAKRGLNRNRTLADCLRGDWNQPDKSLHSPYRYTDGLLEPVEVDAQGDVVYRYNKERE